MILYNPTVSGSLLVTGSLTTTGTITSQTLVVQTITSSIEFNTGSTRNGTLSTNTHEFTGSVLMSGSLTVGGATTLGGNTLLSYSSNTTTANAFPRLGVSNTNATQQDYNVSELYVSAGNGAVNGSLLASYSSTFPSSTPSITLRNTGNSPLYFSTNGTIRQTIAGDGASTFSSTVMATQFFTETNSGTIQNSTATTIFTSSGGGGIWLVTYTIDGNTPQAGYAIVGNARGATLYIYASGVGSQTSLSASGLNLQLTQTAGVALTYKYSAIKLNSI